jgi:hypothetical protein
MQPFELLLRKDSITTEDWQSIVLALSNQIKGLKPFSVAIVFKENLIRFFLFSKQDLSGLSTGIEGLVITPVSKDDSGIIDTNVVSSRLRFLQIRPGSSVIDIKEFYKTRQNLDLRMLKIDIQRVGNKTWSKLYCYFYSGNIVKVSKQQLASFPAHLLGIDFVKSANYLKKSTPKYLNIEKTLHILSSDSQNSIFAVNGFPYFSKNYYLNINSYEFDKHSLILGATGTGKSKLIDLLIERLSGSDISMQYRVVVIDPHAALANDLANIPKSKIINFSGDSTELFPDASADVSAATELTTTLFKSLISEQYNPRLERVLKFSLFVLLTAQTMSLEMLKTFLVDIDVRNRILAHVQGYAPVNVIKFFGTDYNEIRTQYYGEAILPIISLVEEMQMQPTLVGDANLSLAKTIQDNFLTIFSLNKVSMGEKVVKTVAGLIIQQIFLLSQARVFNQKVILIIDEVSLVQNPAIAQILAEARKFNLTIILSQQYFGQIEKDLRDAILSNVYNYYIFKISEEDARALEGNLEIDIPKEILEEAKGKGLKESDVRSKMMVELNPRECLVRIYSHGQLLPCLIGKTVDVAESDSGSAVSPELTPYKQIKLPPKFIQSEETDLPELAQDDVKYYHHNRDRAIKNLGTIASKTDSEKDTNSQGEARG